MKLLIESTNIMLHCQLLTKIAPFFGLRRWICLIFFWQLGCTSLRGNSPGTGNEAPSPSYEPSVPKRDEPVREESQHSTNGTPGSPPAPPLLKMPILPRIGIILGPGGARTYAHIGFLRQLQKRRWNIQGIVGIEMAAPIAALYAHKEQIHEVEWQYFKIKDEDILGSKNYKGKAVSMNTFALELKNIFQNMQTKDLKIPFGCPALNLATGKDFLMSRGTVSNLVELCSPYPPLFLPYKRNVSGIREIKSSADYLRKQGANFIILVNVVSDKNRRSFLKGKTDEVEQILWNELALNYSQPTPGIDALVSLDLGDTDISDFSNKKDLIQTGEKASEKDMDLLTHRLGF